jgi:AcrR family transcriptional regulator
LVLAPRQQRGRDRQEALLQAGLHLTRTRHWDEVKVGDIAKEIGCSTGTFYTRFHDKAAYFEVLIGLVAEVMQQRADAFFAAPERMHETPREFVAQWIDLVLRSFSLTLPPESVSHSRLMHWRAGVGWRASFLRTASG